MTVLGVGLLAGFLLLASCMGSAEQAVFEPRPAATPTAPTFEPPPPITPTMPSVEPSPEPTAAPEPSVEPSPEPTAAPEPPPSDPSIGPLLVSDGSSISRVDPEGTINTIYRAPESVTIENFASDGYDGIVVHQRMGPQENAIAWSSNGDEQLHYLVRATPYVEIDLVGVLHLDGEAFVAYQLVDSCCGALESMGTLRLMSLRPVADRVDLGLRETGAWENVTTFSAAAAPTAAAVEVGHETTTVVEIDWLTGETLFRRDVDAADIAATWDDGLAVATTIQGEQLPRLALSSIDRDTGELSAILSTKMDPGHRVTDMFIQGSMAVLSFENNAEAHDAIPHSWVVDLETGTVRVLTVPGKARPVGVVALHARWPERSVVEVRDSGFEEVSLGYSKDDVLASFGEPNVLEEFVWASTLPGFHMTYDDMYFTLYYGVSDFTVRRPGMCTVKGVCIGDRLADVERTLGFGWIIPAHGETTQPGETRTANYAMPDGGYCRTSFTFGTSENDETETLRSISGSCAPD